MRYSVTMGPAIRELIQQQGAAAHIEADEAFVYGLLHDVGITIFHEYLPREHECALQVARADELVNIAA